MPKLNLIKSRWYSKRKHKSTREQTLTQNWRNPLSEYRLFTVVLLRFLSLSLFTVFTSSISGVPFLLPCRANRGNNASSSFGFTKADALPVMPTLIFSGKHRAWLQTEYHNEREVYREPGYTRMVSFFYSHYTVTSVFNLGWSIVD